MIKNLLSKIPFFGKKAFNDPLNESLWHTLDGSAMDYLGMNKNDYIKQYKNWVYASTNVIANNSAVIELQLFKRKGNGNEDQIFSHPILDLLNKVDNETTLFQALFRVFAEKELCGNSYWWITKDNQIKALPVNSTKFILSKDKIPKILRWESIITSEGQQPQKITINDPSKVIHFKTFNPHSNSLAPSYGVGTVQAAITSIMMDESSNTWNHAFFRNSARPDIALAIDGQMSKEVKERTQKDWNNKYKGKENHGKMVILENGAKIMPLGVSQKEMDFVEQKRFSRDEILAFFQTPKSLLGMVQDANRANTFASREIFALQKIDPNMRWFVGFLNEFFLPSMTGSDDLFFKYKTPIPVDSDVALKENTFYIGNGIKTANEIRGEIGLEPYKGGDVFYRPFGVEPIEQSKINNTPKKSAYIPYKKNIFYGESVKNIISKNIKSFDNKVKKEISQKDLEVIHKATINVSEKQFRRFKAMTIRELDKQEKRVLNNLSKQKSNKALINNIFNLEDEAKIFSQNSLATYFIIYEAGAKDALDKINSANIFAFNETISRQIRQRAAKYFGKEVNQTTLDQLTRQIEESTASGESIEDLQNRIEETYVGIKSGRSEVIARTESLNAINEAQLQVYNDDETVEELQWITTLDGRERSSHEALHKKTRKKDGFFNLAGTKIKRPQDSNLSAKESINCRCTLVAIVKD